MGRHGILRVADRMVIRPAVVIGSMHVESMITKLTNLRFGLNRVLQARIVIVHGA